MSLLIEILYFGFRDVKNDCSHSQDYFLVILASCEAQKGLSHTLSHSRFLRTLHTQKVLEKHLTKNK